MTTGLRIRGLTKSYGANRVLSDLDLDVEAGTVHALLGHNGAGKSTLIKCVNGSTAWDAGQVTLSGIPLMPGSPAAAETAGIATIHQHLSLIDTLSIEQNIHLGREPRWGILCRTRAERRTASAIIGRLGLDVSPGVKVARLGAGQKQLVEIAKALSHSDVHVLILDEPTASLSSAESEVLFKEIAGLRASGVAIIYVTHRLPEVFRISDQVTVMRNGQVVLSAETATVGPREVIAALTGEAHSPVQARTPAATLAAAGQAAGVGTTGGAPGLVVDGLRGPRFGPVSFTVAPGELVGVFGSLGSGRTSLLQTLAGLHRPTAGSASIDGRALPRGGPRRRIRDGVVLIPGDRNGQVCGDPSRRPSTHSHRTPATVSGAACAAGRPSGGSTPRSPTRSPSTLPTPTSRSGPCRAATPRRSWSAGGSAGGGRCVPSWSTTPPTVSTSTPGTASTGSSPTSQGARCRSWSAPTTPRSCARSPIGCWSSPAAGWSPK